ncbi:ATP-binding cassette domain-containing protein [Natronosporangium hydrolyticum]|uniref:ATP-binding cassette domain-containing protein n=1 Tax=Natronosporangium hydrolyticum TaxID=2811111 RepID=A0A895YNM6_9ACTN|nr:ATP-binding cassette domain-containing protein [Natronosporangium hydrolyticum]QSB17562.1 ATP-binding cassette domain-containing protein [Natronosporangium hydrolyticum]
MTRIKVRGLCQGYSGKHVISDLKLDIDRGVVAMLGPNGAGKSTLLRTLATVVPPSAGVVEILGHDVSTARSARAARAEIGYLPQDFGFLPSFTVHEFVQYCAWLRGMSGKNASEAASLAITAVGLSDVAGLRLRKLSGGMLRRCGIAQAVAGFPEVVLLDEPTAGLDPVQRVEFRALLRRLGQSAVVVISTHLVEDVAAACNQVHVLKSGHIRFSGSPEALAAAAAPSAAGDTPLERGYVTVLEEPVAA